MTAAQAIELVSEELYGRPWRLLTADERGHVQEVVESRYGWLEEEGS